MPQLSFYFGPGACSLASHIALEESGAAFEAKPVALRRGQQYTPDYVTLNPKSKVPLLLVDGRPLTENVAIITYLARSHPAAGLLPAGDSFREAEALSLLAWCASGIHPVMTRLFRPQLFSDLPDSAENVRRLAVEANARNFALVDQMLQGRDYMLGSFSAVDGYLMVFWRWAALLKLDVSPYGNYAGLIARLLTRPAIQRVLAREQEAAAALEAAA